MKNVTPIGFRKNGLPIWPIRGGDGSDDGEGTPEGEAGDPSAAALALTPEAIRNSPEFQALEKQNRLLARQKGTAERQASEARGAAEAVRQAAEASQQEALDAQLRNTLGDEGVAEWTALAELSQTDQPAAARRFAELMARRAQTPPAAGAQPTTEPTPASEGEGTVPVTTPPPPLGGGGGDAPLGAPRSASQTVEQLTTALDNRYEEIVARVNDPMTRNRVTMRERAEGMIAFVASAYTKRMGLGPTERR